MYVPFHLLFLPSCISDFPSGINFFLLGLHSLEFLLMRFWWWKTLFLNMKMLFHLLKVFVLFSTFSDIIPLTSELCFC